MSLMTGVVTRHRRTAAFLLLALSGAAIAPGLSAPAGAATTNGWLRIGHFALGSSAVDEYVDGAVQTTSVAYTQVTPYAQVAVGVHTIALRAAGAPATAPAMATLTAAVGPDSAATVAVVNGPNGFAGQLFTDDLSAPPSGDAKVRVIHAVGTVDAVNVFVSPAPAAPTSIVASPQAFTLPNVAPAFTNLSFGAASPYAALPAGSYEVDLEAAATSKVVLAAHNWPVIAGTIASVVVLKGPDGVTLEVLRDAVGTTATPAGAMATGEGGMAHRHHGGLPVTWLLGGVLVAGAAATLGRRRLHLIPATLGTHPPKVDARP